ncbi:zinc-dependent metalloprotease [uncultured Draconibacterium sp.]|uniref:zinc-dependent metalloprotease n=1 Tax=uncultured Draconibacterium sp. TaxID=1573823 RepID=UPI002AA8B3EE|nr:zinc-dependent metalloprotease [uncultured Draconibacterium sp.]
MKKHYLLILLIALNIGISEVAAREFTGFFNFTYNEEDGKIELEIRQLDTEFLYVTSLASGVGSNDLGLDRGKLTGTRVVKFVKAGNKILLVQVNYSYRASSSNADEVKAVDDAFATSVLWGFTISKEENGTYFLDATDFLLEDRGRVAATLQGSYKLEKSRSAIYKDGLRSFPKNSEFESILTFTGKPTGRLVGSVTPSADAVTIRLHHSFIELPDDNYKIRDFDPRAGYGGIGYMDYATPIDEPITKRFIRRHRLEKKDPNAAISEPVEPIIYYVDRGAPEPIKSALIEGASWWNQAYEAAGFKNAFIVKEMPEGADMLDVRYNVIQWVHRSTRGWSYGASVMDPRTGEILKGHVSLGSLRIRQDFMIAQGLISPYGGDAKEVERAKEMALARIRQLSAHEVGHTLGLSHAYSSSAEGRTSVMDYPHPLVKIKNGKIDLSEAYDDKIGEWDKTSIAYGYSQFPEGTDEKAALNDIISESLESGLSFLSDATSASGVHPYTHQWDNGENPYDELLRMMEIRKIALKNFGENTIPEGTPYATLENVLVPIYYFHRYQITASAKVLGGLNYRYALKGDGQFVAQMVPAEEQEKALHALLAALTPEALAIPEKLLELIPPQPMSYSRSQTENVQSKTGTTFDPLSAAGALANMVFSEITDSQRAQRMLEYHSRNADLPSLNSVLDKIISATWKTDKRDGYYGELQKVVDNSFLTYLAALATDAAASSEVKAIAWLKLQDLLLFTTQKYATSSGSIKAHYGYAMSRITQFEKDPERFAIIRDIMPPQGAPIGME